METLKIVHMPEDRQDIALCTLSKPVGFAMVVEKTVWLDVALGSKLGDTMSLGNDQTIRMRPTDKKIKEGQYPWGEVVQIKQTA